MEIVTSWELEGRQETQEEIPINLLNRKIAVKEIAEITGLAVEQVEKLQAQLQKED